ncbi:MAG: DegV family protein [Haloplasmataceae bacterium]|jgi:DegV family protein with EDD domain|nr:DegV family protein [Haloplasmataceae bacterium]
MSKIGIITCSTSGLDFLKGYEDIRIARTTIIMDSKEYLDGLEITPKEFYAQLDNLQTIPKTAMPSTGHLVEIYEQLKQEGYTDAIYISISDHLSGTFQNVCIAKDLVEGINIHPFNSKTATFITGFMAIEAHRLSKEGKSVEEILAYLEKLRDNDRIFLMVDDLKFLVKNGRLSNASGFIAQALKIKPLLELNNDGKIVATEKIRTTRKAIDRVIESFLEDTNFGNDAKFVFLFNTEAPEHVAYIKAVLEENRIDTSNFIDAPVSPGIGCHVGKGVVGIGYIKNFA